ISAASRPSLYSSRSDCRIALAHVLSLSRSRCPAHTCLRPVTPSGFQVDQRGFLIGTPTVFIPIDLISAIETLFGAVLGIVKLSHLGQRLHLLTKHIAELV